MREPGGALPETAPPKVRAIVQPAAFTTTLLRQHLPAQCGPRRGQVLRFRGVKS